MGVLGDDKSSPQGLNFRVAAAPTMFVTRATRSTEMKVRRCVRVQEPYSLSVARAWVALGHAPLVGRPRHGHRTSVKNRREN
eukprot:5038171-Pyramimonas_sp.AAC.2